MVNGRNPLRRIFDKRARDAHIVGSANSMGGNNVDAGGASALPPSCEAEHGRMNPSKP